MPRHLTSLRIPEPLLQRIAAYQKQLESTLPPGIRLSRTEVLCALLERGLEVMEQESGGPDGAS